MIKNEILVLTCFQPICWWLISGTRNNQWFWKMANSNEKIITQMHKFGFLVFRRIRIICVISDKNVNCRTNHQFTGYNLDSVYVCSGIKFYSQFLENIIKINFFECPLSLAFVTLTLQKIKKNLVYRNYLWISTIFISRPTSGTRPWIQ